MSYTGSIDLISGLRPKNNGTFPLINAPDVLVDETSDTRLDEALAATDEHFKGVSVDPESGTMTFTRESGETVLVTPQPAIEAGDGIEVSGNTVSLPRAFYDYLDEQTYLKPVIDEFFIPGFEGEAELGTSIDVSEIRHSESNPENIAAGTLNLMISTSSRDPVLSGIEPSETLAVRQFGPMTITRDTPGTRFFTLTCRDTKNNVISKSVTRTFYVPKFLGSSAAAGVTAQEILSMSKGRSMPANITLSGTAYIYFVTNDTISTVKDAATGFGVPIEAAERQMVSINGINISYRVYRTSSRITAGTYSFIIS